MWKHLLLRITPASFIHTCTFLKLKVCPDFAGVCALVAGSTARRTRIPRYSRAAGPSGAWAWLRRHPGAAGLSWPGDNQPVPAAWSSGLHLALSADQPRQCQSRAPHTRYLCSESAGEWMKIITGLIESYHCKKLIEIIIWEKKLHILIFLSLFLCLTDVCLKKKKKNIIKQCCNSLSWYTW